MANKLKAKEEGSMHRPHWRKLTWVIIPLACAASAQAAASPAAQKRAVIAYCSRKANPAIAHWSAARKERYVLQVMVPHERKIGPMFDPIWTLEAKLARDFLQGKTMNAIGDALALKAAAKAAGIAACAH